MEVPTKQFLFFTFFSCAQVGLAFRTQMQSSGSSVGSAPKEADSTMLIQSKVAVQVRLGKTADLATTLEAGTHGVSGALSRTLKKTADLASTLEAGTHGVSGAVHGGCEKELQRSSHMASRASVPTSRANFDLMQLKARRITEDVPAPASTNVSDVRMALAADERSEGQECIELVVGSSGKNKKTVHLPAANYTCPANVNRDNWLGGDTYGDTFEISQSSTKVTVRRSNSVTGWGMKLRFHCCRDDGKLPTCLFLHGAMVKGARPTQFKSWYGDIAGALRTYWGPFNVWYADLCSEFLYSWAETETNAWTDSHLQDSYADKAAEVIRSGGIVFAHSMANAILAGACWHRDKCVQWYSLGGGYSGQAVGNGVLTVIKAMGPLGSSLMNTKVYEGFDFRNPGMRHDPNEGHRNAMAKLVDEKGLLKGSVCGIKPEGAALSGNTQAPDWGLDVGTALKHENHFDQHVMGVAMKAASALCVDTQLQVVGDDLRNDGLVEIASCSYWQDEGGRHWYGTGSEWKTYGPTDDPSDTHILAEINHIEECGVFPQTSVAQNWIRNMMCRDLRAKGKECPLKSIPMEWPVPSGKIGEACIPLIKGCSDGECCGNKGHNICQRKLKDYVGNHWCPAECQGIPGVPGSCEDDLDRLHWPRKLNEMCALDTDCKGWKSSHPTGCCNHVCTRKKKDWASLWWCPDVCKGAWYKGPGSC